MSEIGAISPVGSTSQIASPSQVNITQAPGQSLTGATSAPESDFGSLLADAVETLDTKVAEADRMVTQFALDETTPIHHVTIALEEARMAVELTTQVRQRLTEGYRELMNMQL
ncbi:MAG: flagellar hook-basal body complex protein FliE [Pseudomonadota bacterium]